MNRRQFLAQTGATATGVTALAAFSGTVAAAERETPIVSTRGHFNEDWNGGVELTEGYTTTGYDTTGDVPGIDTTCAEDLTVYIHGWNNDADAAIGKANQAFHELEGAGYAGVVVGYSWDSDIGNWFDAKDCAAQNGPKLARFLREYKQRCPSGRLRLVSHSLGARVIMYTLRALAADSVWQASEFTVDTVHLLGAAVDNEVPTTDRRETHDLIENETGHTFNYYNADDRVLIGSAKDFYRSKR